MRILFALSVLSSAIITPSLCTAACVTDGPVSQVGTVSSSDEQSTFGYACPGEGSEVRVVERSKNSLIIRFGAEAFDPEKQTYGTIPRLAEQLTGCIGLSEIELAGLEVVQLLMASSDRLLRRPYGLRGRPNCDRASGPFK